MPQELKKIILESIQEKLSEGSEKIVSKKLVSHAYDAAHADPHEFKKYVKDEYGVHAQLHYHGHPDAYKHEVTHITYHGPAHAVKKAAEEHHEVEEMHTDGDEDFAKELHKNRKALLKTKSHPDIDKMNEKEHKEAEEFKKKHS